MTLFISFAGYLGWNIRVLSVQSCSLVIPGYLFGVLSSPTMLFTKITFFIMYLDIFHLMRWLKISAYIGGFVRVLFYGSMTVFYFVLSTPGRHETWFEKLQGRGQHYILAFNIPQSCGGPVIDLYILVLPILGVIRLQMPIRRKVGVILIFMSATMVCLCSLLSIYYRWNLVRATDKQWALDSVLVTT
ncbi:hypothetical protein N7G274_008644 [Stereocaulon virgatum]|uniref:Rhodopsin domain-containing protein n=1 Tax=Stereocaulon virgatum TaxID=373712 RepID=A0ABR4A0T6_9LECA